MTANLEDLAVMIMLIFVVPAMILSVYQRVIAHRAKIAYAQHLVEFNRRLQQPQFDDVQKHFGRPIPEAYKRLYRDPGRVLNTNFLAFPPGSKDEDRAWPIASFLPADATTLAEAWPNLGKINLPFACDEVGDPYYIPLDEADSLDGPVWQFHHQGGEREQVAKSLLDFLSWPTRPDD
jgi:hypothetical protein